MSLKDDARTSDALRSRRVRSAQVDGALREALGDERVEHVLKQRFPDGVIVLTSTRLIRVVVGNPSDVKVLPRPLHLTFNPASTGARRVVLVRGADGTRARLRLARPELTGLASVLAEFPTPGQSWSWGQPVRTWSDAEQMAADHMHHLGFDGVWLTGPGSDGGLDVLCADAAAQVKHHAASASSPKINELAGAGEGLTARLFYSLSGYTRDAIVAADARAVALFTYPAATGTPLPVNAAARALVPSERNASSLLGNQHNRIAKQLRMAALVRRHARTADLTDAQRERVLTLVDAVVHELRGRDPEDPDALAVNFGLVRSHHRLGQAASAAGMRRA